MLIPRVKFGLLTLAGDKALAFGGATNGTLGLVNGTNVSALYTPAFNFTQLELTISPALAPGDIA